MADFSLEAAFFRRAVWEASPKIWFSPLGEALKVSGPGRARHECHGAAGAGWAASPGDSFGLSALSSPVLGHGWSAQPQMLPAPHLGDPRPTPHTCGPPASHPRALGEGIKVQYKWPAWEGFPYGIGFNSVWLLFPFKLDSGWDSFLSGGSQLPRCCHFLFYVSVEYFSSSSGFFFFFFLPPKEHIWTLCPLLIVTLTSVDSPTLRVVGPSSNTISNTVMQITQHCDLI